MKEPKFQHGVLSNNDGQLMRRCAHEQGERCEYSGMDGTEEDFMDKVSVHLTDVSEIPLAETLYEATEPEVGGWNRKSKAYYRNYDSAFGKS